MKLALEKGKSRTLRLRRSLQAITRRSGSLYGSGRKSTALVTLKIAVLAPTPNAIVSAAVSAKIGLFRSVRPANARSCNGIFPPPSRSGAKNTTSVSRLASSLFGNGRCRNHFDNRSLTEAYFPGRFATRARWRTSVLISANASFTKMLYRRVRSGLKIHGCIFCIFLSLLSSKG